ncbi:MAG: hypothetical protein GEU93_19045 [Propionibacteriales bacterium]|nr:hypothetical protein [Propionibacteriales bacterium]
MAQTAHPPRVSYDPRTPNRNQIIQSPENRGNLTFDVTWTAVGELQTTVNPNVAEGFSVNTSTRKQREAVADGRVTFDGTVLVDGPNNHPTRPAPFIRTDEERTTRTP